ncbi:armadillo-like helical domain-containing protein 4 isoform X2 [Anguilla rostrata]|uniref:armadillo-like helical domain-containing protein 4 isoform X2 n=1 Tax=Anguilla rostrata TaxID=7938 RepID=UPI0030D5914C
MVWCEILWVCLLAVVSLLASVNTLPLSPLEESSQKADKQPEGAQGLTDSVLAPATPIFPLVALDGLSQNIVPTNQVEQPASDDSSVQLRASEARLQDSGWRVESTAVGPVEVHGRAEATLASVRARLGREGEAPLLQTGGDDGRDVLMLKKPGDPQGPGAVNTQNQRKERNSEEGPNQGVLLNGRTWESPAGYRAPDGLGSHDTSQNPHILPQAERAGSVHEVAIGFSGIPQTPSVAKVLEPGGMAKQGISNATLHLLSPSMAPVGQEPSSEGGMQVGPQVTVATQVKDPDLSRAQSRVGLPELDALLSAREEPGVEGNERGAETAKKPLKNRMGVPGGGFQTTTAASGEAMAGTSGPSLSRAPSSEQTRPRQTTAIDSIQQSTTLVANILESEAASPPSTPIPHRKLINSPSNGESRARANTAQPGFSEDPAGPTTTKPPLGEDPGAEPGVSIVPWARGALQQDAVKSSIPSSTGPVNGVTPHLLLTARTETRTRGENQALKALPFGHDDEATPTPDDIPLIFEPLDDALSEMVVTTAPSGTQQVLQFSGITADTQDILTGPELITTVIVDGGPSPSGAARPTLQTSGTEIMEALSPSTSLFTAPPPEPPLDDGILYTEELGMTDTPTGTTEGSPSSFRTREHKNTELSPTTIVATATSMSLPRHKSGVVELESEEEPDDKETGESKDAGSEEDVSEVMTVAHVRPTYSHIPYHFHPGSIWVQRNQGLVHSWVEKIRDKAGYVSGMLAPVGIGIAGALFILGALYGIKVVHRRRRKGYKRQTRKHRESGSRQDRVMLLADSSEDEF